MAEVLVLVDHVDGAVRKTTLEMLTIARRLGEPSAVLIGAGFDVAREVLAQYGAEKIYRVESAEVTDFLVAPTVEVLEQIVASVAPAAVLIPSSAEGKEIAGRLSIKTESGLITDAVDVQAGEGGAARTTQSVFAGDFTVQAHRVFDNLAAVLREGGSSFDKVVKATVYLPDLANFQTLNSIYAEYFGNHKPARSTVGVKELPRGAQVEIDLIAVV